MSPKIRVLVRDVPRLVHDVLIHAIAAQPDMLLVDVGAAEQTPPDAVVLATRRRSELHDVEPTLWRYPRSQVLAITVDGCEAASYELVPQRQDLGELSPDDLLDCIRTAMARRRERAAPGGPA